MEWPTMLQRGNQGWDNIGSKGQWVEHRQTGGCNIIHPPPPTQNPACPTYRNMGNTPGYTVP